jgi:hypothetical protein
MRPIGVRIRTTCLFRALLCGVLLLGHIVATFGYPLLPRPGASGNHFCHGRACGCPDTVEPRACCCSGSPVAAEPEEKACCAKKAKMTCCAAPVDKAKMTAKQAAGWRWLLTVQGQRCKGEMPFGALAAEPVNPVPEVLPSLTAAPAGLMICTSIVADVVPAAPPSPPPRFV